MYNRKKIVDLRNFITQTLYDYEYEKINSSDNEFADRLKLICYFIDEKIKTTIEYYQYNKASITEIEKAKDKCKDLSILLNKYKTELTKLGINPNEQLSFKKEVNDAFELTGGYEEKPKELLPNYLEIKKEFEDFIKIEAPESKDKSKSKTIIDENDLKFQVCLHFASGKIYELHSKGFSHPKKAEELFKNHDKTNSIIAFIKNTYSNISKEKNKSNQSKNLFNNIELIAFVKNHCIEKGIDINSTFLMNATETTQKN